MNGGTRASGTPGFDASADYVAERLAQRRLRRHERRRSTSRSSTRPGRRASAARRTTRTRVFDGPGRLRRHGLLGLRHGDRAGPGRRHQHRRPERRSTSGCEDSRLRRLHARATSRSCSAGRARSARRPSTPRRRARAAAIIMNQGNDPGSHGPLLRHARRAGGDPDDQRVVPVRQRAGRAGHGRCRSRRRRSPRSAQTQQRHRRPGAEERQRRPARSSSSARTSTRSSRARASTTTARGTAAILEIAEAAGRATRRPANPVRFAFWGAEEAGLLGSEHYVGIAERRRAGRRSA